MINKKNYVKEKLSLLLVGIFLIGFVSSLSITEVELNPSGTDSGYEWIELYSDEELNLEGYKLVNNDGDEIILSGSVEGYFVHVFEKQWLDNSNEKVFLYKGDELVDETELFEDNENNNLAWSYCPEWNFVEATKGEENFCEGDKPVNSIEIPFPYTLEQKEILENAFEKILELTAGTNQISKEEREELIDDFDSYADDKQKEVLNLLWQDLTYYTKGTRQLNNDEFLVLKEKYFPVAECYANSDCGTDAFIGDNYCLDGNVVRNYKKYICNNAGTTTSYCLDSISNGLIEECEIECNEGICSSGGGIGEIKEMIRETEEAIKEAETEIERAKAAGIDMTELEIELEKAKEDLRKLKQEYGGDSGGEESSSSGGDGGITEGIVEINPIQKDCEGCSSNNECLPISYRTSDKYCDADKTMKNQKQEEKDCNNNFECKSNICVDGKCISSGLIQKILNFFKRLFGL